LLQVLELVLVNYKTINTVGRWNVFLIIMIRLLAQTLQRTTFMPHFAQCNLEEMLLLVFLTMSNTNQEAVNVQLQLCTFIDCGKYGEVISSRKHLCTFDLFLAFLLENWKQLFLSGLSQHSKSFMKHYLVCLNELGIPGIN
ncbi:hypothetical protein ATANTOWER_030386, partial [Ataeniobius toweri]|nr:hypothetical protein [Ataeniobius toweri]